MMSLKHLLAAACLAITATAAGAYPYESEFKARGAYAHGDYDHYDHYDRHDARGWRDDRGWHDAGSWRERRYGGGERHCWYERRHHQQYRVCR